MTRTLSYPPPAAQNRARQAIVLLTGHRSRVATAVQVQRDTGLPIIVSGRGAERYVQMLSAQGAKVLMVEDASVNTEQNAAFVTCDAQTHGIQMIVLVTSHTHMRRAMYWFAWYGFDTTPRAAPDYLPARRPSPWLPSSSGLRQTRLVAHEWLGLVAAFLKTKTGQHIDCKA